VAETISAGGTTDSSTTRSAVASADVSRNRARTAGASSADDMVTIALRIILSRRVLRPRCVFRARSSRVRRPACAAFTRSLHSDTIRPMRRMAIRLWPERCGCIRRSAAHNCWLCAVRHTKPAGTTPAALGHNREKNTHTHTHTHTPHTGNAQTQTQTHTLVHGLPSAQTLVAHRCNARVFYRRSRRRHRHLRRHYHHHNLRSHYYDDDDDDDDDGV